MVYQAQSRGGSQSQLVQMIKEKRWSDAIDKLRSGTTGSFEFNSDRSTLKYPLHVVASAFDAPSEQLCTLISLLLQVQVSITDARDKSGYTPLHLACAFGLDINCIRVLIEANQSACGLLTNKGDTPLSLACQRSKTSHETIVLLLDHSCDAASLKNNGGWLPLHCAVWHELPILSLKAIIRSFPDAVYSRTYSSDHTPLSLYWTNHISSSLSQDERDTISILCDTSASSEAGILHKVLSFPQYLPGLVQSILLSFPDEAMIQDEFGRLPLHRIIENVQFPVSDIQQVLSAYPEATSIVHPLTGDIPLVSAITSTVRNFKWQEIPQDILQRFPDAIYYCNKHNKLYPFMMAAAYSSLEVCFDLLRSAPELVYP